MEQPDINLRFFSTKEKVTALLKEKKIFFPLLVVVLIPLFFLSIVVQRSSQKSLDKINSKQTQKSPSSTTIPSIAATGTSIMPNKQLSQEEQAKAQQIADENYRKSEAEIERNFPWLEKLPLKSSDYFFYFDVEKKSFVGQLYPKQSAVSQNDQVSAMKTEIFSRLQEMAIPTTYSFEWEITPE